LKVFQSFDVVPTRGTTRGTVPSIFSVV